MGFEGLAQEINHNCNAVCNCAECHYAECHYADCHYADCRGAQNPTCVDEKKKKAMEQHIFWISFITEGTTEKVYKFYTHVL